jgi:hypothetical protein
LRSANCSKGGRHETFAACNQANKATIYSKQFPIRSRQRTGTTNNAGKTTNKNMQLKVSVVSDRPDEYVGKKGLVKQQVITCQDVDPSGYRLLMPFDYTLNEEEKAKWAGKLQDKQIVVGVRELVPFGGRLRARGAIIRGPDGKINTQTQ